jgi:hypothetical protein
MELVRVVLDDGGRMMHRGRVIHDFRGTERRRLRPEDLLARFEGDPAGGSHGRIGRPDAEGSVCVTGKSVLTIHASIL